MLFPFGESVISIPADAFLLKMMPRLNQSFCFISFKSSNKKLSLSKDTTSAPKVFASLSFCSTLFFQPPQSPQPLFLPIHPRVDCLNVFERVKAIPTI